MTEIPEVLSLTDLAIWIGMFGLFAYLNSFRRRGSFLVNAYLAGFVINHWLGAMVHASPWSPFYDSSNTVTGFRVSTYGFISLAAGALLVPAYMSRRQPRAQSILDASISNVETNRIVTFYLILGLVTWILSFTNVAQIPSLSAVISAGKQGVIFAVCMRCWIAWHSGNKRKFISWLLLSAMFPFVTLLSSGFLGYGIGMMVTILVFTATFYKPRWRLVTGCVAAIYVGLSIFVAYAESRNDIRAAVWGGESLGTRIDAVSGMFDRLRPFNPWDEDQDFWIDLRLNQNELVGAAVRYTPAETPFAYGATIVEAVMAIIPRVVWPDKPFVGSRNYVSQYTGIEFGEGTSVGMGQVLEFYINFGTSGVIIGFLFLGMALCHMDDRLFHSLSRGDWHSAALWFFMGTAAIQFGGSLGEVTSSMAAGAVLILASRYILRKRSRDSHAASGAPRRGGPLPEADNL